MGCASCLKGAVGIAKSVVGVDRAPSAEVVRRLAVCGACEQGVPCKRDSSRACRCSVCRCALSLKTRVASERCPLGRW